MFEPICWVCARLIPWPFSPKNQLVNADILIKQLWNDVRRTYGVIPYYVYQQLN